MTTSGRSEAVMVTRPEKLLSRSVPPGSSWMVRVMCSVSSPKRWPAPPQARRRERKDSEGSGKVYAWSV